MEEGERSLVGGGGVCWLVGAVARTQLGLTVGQTPAVVSPQQNKSNVPQRLVNLGGSWSILS